MAIAAIVLIAAGGIVAVTDLGFGPNAVHITQVNLEFLGGRCDGWSNSSVAGISANAGSQVGIPIPLTDSAPSGNCVAQNVSVEPTSFTVVSANVPLTVGAGGTQTLAVTVGLPHSAYSGPLTIFVGVSTGG